MSSQIHKPMIIALIAALSITAPSASFAKDGNKAHDFSTLDTDKSGGVSKAEFIAHREKRATDADANKDGTLSQDELKAALQKRGGKASKRAERRISRLMDHADANEDGVLSVAEYKGHGSKRLDRMFSKLDSDANGEISQDELKKMRRGHKHKKAAKE